MLTAFTLSDMYDAAREPIEAVQLQLEVDDDAIAWLWERTQGHPYFVTYGIHYAFQTAMDAQWLALTKTHLNQVWPSIVSARSR
jgi:hypothetical protein